MFDTLIESKAKRSRSTGQAVVSVVIHGLLLFGAAKAAAGVAEEIASKPKDTTVVFLKPPPPPPPPKVEQPPPPDVIVSRNPPPKGFQTVAPPDIIPKEIPPVDLSQKAFDPKDFMGKGVEGGVASGVVGGSGPVEVKGEVFLSSELDDPVQSISSGALRYPPMMQSAGIEGSVEVQFVVDTLGRPERTSLKVIKSTHKQFEEPAREAVMKSVFKPARFRGAAVRQLVQQRLSFTLTGR